MELKKYKLGVGPMSREIIDVINCYDKDLMVVTSRNQIDHDSGYVCQVKDLKLSKDKIFCRDHCGPYFSDLDTELSLDESILKCKKTITTDIEHGVEIIHIDVSRIPAHLQEKYAIELIEFTINLKPSIIIEFGSEENTGTEISGNLSRIYRQLEIIKPYIKNVRFFVTQTGSLVKHDQVGIFDIHRNKEIIDLVHAQGFLFKEHNADYLSAQDLQLRKDLGVDALNIAPQLGVVQTRILLEQSGPSPFLTKFKQRVISGNKFSKWLPKGFYNEDSAFEVSAHYFFNTLEYRDLLNTIDIELYKNRIATEITKIFDFYLGAL